MPYASCGNSIADPDLSELLENRAYISPDATSKCKSAVLVGVDTTLVQVTDVQLDAGMVLGSDELVCPRAAPAQQGEILEPRGHVAVSISKVSLPRTYHLRGMYRSTMSPSSFCIFACCCVINESSLRDTDRFQGSAATTRTIGTQHRCLMLLVKRASCTDLKVSAELS